MKYEMSKLIGSPTESPFDKIGITEDMFMPIKDVLGKNITIVAYKNYTKNDSPGVFIAFTIGGEMKYLATHSVALVRVFQDPEVTGILDGGDTIDAKIVEKKSLRTGRMYQCFASSEDGISEDTQ